MLPVQYSEYVVAGRVADIRRSVPARRTRPVRRVRARAAAVRQGR